MNTPKILVNNKLVKLAKKKGSPEHDLLIGLKKSMITLQKDSNVGIILPSDICGETKEQVVKISNLPEEGYTSINELVNQGVL